MVLQNLQQVRETLQDAGASVGSTAGAFSKAVGQYVCGLYDKYPEWMTGKAVDIPGFVSGVRRSFLDEVCGPPAVPPPPPPPPPFNGGQCKKIYIVNGYMTSYNVTKDGSTIQTLNGVPREVWGPVQPPSFTSGGSLRYTGTHPTTGLPQYVLAGASGGQPPYKGYYTSIVLKDGSPDNCGDPAAPPPPPPPAPGPADFNQTVNVNVKVDIDPKVDVNIPFTFTNLNFDLNVPVNFNLDLDVGGPKFNLDFGPDGIDIRKLPPGSSPDNPSFIPPGIKDKIDGTFDKVVECCPKNNEPEKPDEYEKRAVPSSGPKQETGVLRLAYVEVNLESYPKNIKEQFGNGAPNVKYTGWFEFRRGIWQFPREPIHFDNSVFKAPSGADGYAYTTYGGYVTNHSVITHKET